MACFIHMKYSVFKRVETTFVFFYLSTLFFKYRSMLKL